MEWLQAYLGELKAMGFAGYIRHSYHKYGKLGPRANKYMFIRYCEHSKGYVMYGEHHDWGLAEIESCDVDFIDDDFPSVGEIK